MIFIAQALLWLKIPIGIELTTLFVGFMNSGESKRKYGGVVRWVKKSEYTNLLIIETNDYFCN